MYKSSIKKAGDNSFGYAAVVTPDKNYFKDYHDKSFQLNAPKFDDDSRINYRLKSTIIINKKSIELDGHQEVPVSAADYKETGLLIQIEQMEQDIEGQLDYTMTFFSR